MLVNWDFVLIFAKQDLLPPPPLKIRNKGGEYAK